MLTQVMANNFMHYNTLAKQSPVKSKTNLALFSCFNKTFENRFQNCKKKKKISFLCIFLIPFSLNIKTLPDNF